jgi:hypothetical protein
MQWGDCGLPADSGTDCTGTCAFGYQGTPTATCNLGSWTFVTASTCGEKRSPSQTAHAAAAGL